MKDEILKLYLSNLDISLISFDSPYPAKLFVFVIKGDVDKIPLNQVKASGKYLNIKDPKLKILNFQIDERKFNNIIGPEDITLDEKNSYNRLKTPKSTVWYYIKDKFESFKKSKVEYGNYEPGYTLAIEGTEPLKIKDFFNYMKNLNRDEVINNILVI